MGEKRALGGERKQKHGFTSLLYGHETEYAMRWTVWFVADLQGVLRYKRRKVTMV